MPLPLRRGTLLRRPRDWIMAARRRWRLRGRRLTALLGFLLVSAALLVVCMWKIVVEGVWQPLPGPRLAPPMNRFVFPFDDLCDAVNATATRNSSTVQQQDTAHALRRVQARLRHIPADGGAAGLRWSAATSLPLPSARAGRYIAAHFVTLSTRTDDVVLASTAAATMAGVPLSVVGVGWTWFTFARRMELLSSFLNQAGVAEDDVVMCTDADALLSGEDVYDSIAAFTASTAATPVEHADYAVRDVRQGRRQPPVLFSAEYNCMHAQAYPSRHLCATGYDQVDAAIAQWATRAGVPLPSEHAQLNPLRYLNAGVVVARVWALRRVWAAARAFMSTHQYYEGDEWWCDQSVLASLYLQLRWWEVESGVLDGATPHALSAHAEAACPFPPLVLPDVPHGPHGLPGGLIGLDHAGRFSFVISAHVLPKGLLQIGRKLTTAPEAALMDYLRTSARAEAGLTTSLRSSHHLQVSPRNGVDCAAGDVAVTEDRPPECVYRAAVLGVPENAAAITPLLWHFAGKHKRTLMTRFRTVFPWYTPTLWNTTVRQEVVAVLAAAPPTRVWYINATTDLPFPNVRHELYPHREEDDRSFESLCTLASVQGAG